MTLHMAMLLITQCSKQQTVLSTQEERLSERGCATSCICAGDSMTRQMFMRLISEFRGEERSFDYGPHTGARYDVCGGPFPADR